MVFCFSRFYGLSFLGSLVLFLSGALVLQFYVSHSSSLVIIVLWLISSLVPLLYGSLIVWSGSSVAWFSRFLVLNLLFSRFSGSMNL